MDSTAHMIVKVRSPIDEVVNINIDSENTIQNFNSGIEDGIESSLKSSHLIVNPCKDRKEMKIVNYILNGK